MQKQQLHLIWFRRDLRVLDNWMLSHASKRGFVLPIFIIDPYFYDVWDETGQRRIQFLHQSLQNLNENLTQLGSPLTLFRGNPVEVFRSVLAILLVQFEVQVWFHRDRQLEYGKSRDQSVIELCKSLHIPCHIGDNNFLLLNQVEHHQWRTELFQFQKQTLWPIPSHCQGLAKDIIQNLPYIFPIQSLSSLVIESPSQCTGGETSAQQVLQSFVKTRFYGYHWKLSRPHLAASGATSHLSPHIMWGTISVRTVTQAASSQLEFFQDQGDTKAAMSLKAFIERLRWREHFTQRLYFEPRYATQNWYQEFDEIYHWNLSNQQQEYYERWKDGTTGFPLLDAAMRHLKTEGWLNFRMRAMAATFLTINCGVSWHYGALHFMNQLVDGDVAIDHWQWQMQAGITNPLSKTFRIYNPDKNIRTKDPELEYIKTWIPEVRSASQDQLLHDDFNIPGYPKRMLNFTQTKIRHGKKIADIRARVRQRLTQQTTDNLPAMFQDALL